MIDNIDDMGDINEHEEICNDKHVSNHKSVFVAVDRDREDCLVNEYQTTQDAKTLQSLYEMRKQTLQIFSKKYKHLNMNNEDVFSEASMIWMKCVNQYEYKPKKRTVKTKGGKVVIDQKGRQKTVFKRTPFNTFLYSSLLHHMSNIYKRQHSKKRVDKNGNPQEQNLISIDYEYETCSNNSSSVSLKDMLICDLPLPYSRISVENTIEEISEKDDDIKDALVRFVSDGHIKKISSACQNIVDRVAIYGKDIKIFNGHRGTARKRLKNIIKHSNKYSIGYKLINFRYDDNAKVVTFEVRRSDTVVLRKTIKALEKYRQKLVGNIK